jgi:hypothetical protein
MDDFDIWLWALDEHDKEQGKFPGHPNDLVTLLSVALDEVVVPHHMIRILEDFRRGLERDPMEPSIPSGLCGVPRESRLHITLLNIHTEWARDIQFRGSGRVRLSGH